MSFNKKTIQTSITEMFAKVNNKNKQMAKPVVESQTNTEKLPITYEAFQGFVTNLNDIATQISNNTANAQSVEECAKQYYYDFYLKPEVRNQYSYKLVPCPASLKNKILEIPGDTTAPQHSLQKHNSKRRTHAESRDVKFPVTYETFKKYLKHKSLMKQIIWDRAEGNKEVYNQMYNDKKNYERVLHKYYVTFYKYPERREEYKYKFHGASREVLQQLFKSGIDDDTIKSTNEQTKLITTYVLPEGVELMQNEAINQCLKLTISMQKFCNLILNMDEIVDEILRQLFRDNVERFNEANSNKQIRECIVNEYYRLFYLEPAIRNQYKYKIRPCPTYKKMQFLLTPVVDYSNIIFPVTFVNFKNFINYEEIIDQLTKYCIIKDSQMNEMCLSTFYSIFYLAPIIVRGTFQYNFNKAPVEQREIFLKFASPKLETSMQTINIINNNNNLKKLNTEIVSQAQLENNIDQELMTMPSKSVRQKVPENVVFPVSIKTFKEHINYDDIINQIIYRMCKGNESNYKTLRASKEFRKQQFIMFYKSFYLNESTRKIFKYKFKNASPDLTDKLLSYATEIKVAAASTDTVSAQQPIDTVSAQESTDIISEQEPTDTVSAHAINTVYAQESIDIISAQEPTDAISAQESTGTVSTQKSIDTVFAQGSVDIISEQELTDTVFVQMSQHNTGDLIQGANINSNEENIANNKELHFGQNMKEKQQSNEISKFDLHSDLVNDCLQLPVTLQEFTSYVINCSEIVNSILTDFTNNDMEKFNIVIQDRDFCYIILCEFYRLFYILPQFRYIYDFRLKPCPQVFKNHLLTTKINLNLTQIEFPITVDNFRKFINYEEILDQLIMKTIMKNQAAYQIVRQNAQFCEKQFLAFYHAFYLAPIITRALFEICFIGLPVTWNEIHLNFATIKRGISEQMEDVVEDEISRCENIISQNKQVEEHHMCQLGGNHVEKALIMEVDDYVVEKEIVQENAIMQNVYDKDKQIGQIYVHEDVIEQIENVKEKRMGQIQEEIIEERKEENVKEKQITQVEQIIRQEQVEYIKEKQTIQIDKLVEEKQMSHVDQQIIRQEQIEGVKEKQTSQVDNIDQLSQDKQISSEPDGRKQMKTSIGNSNSTEKMPLLRKNIVFPVSIQTFKKYINYKEVLDEIIMRVAHGNARRYLEIRDNKRMCQVNFRKYYYSFYLYESTRKIFHHNFDAAPEVLKAKLLSFAKVNTDPAANNITAIQQPQGSEATTTTGQLCEDLANFQTYLPSNFRSYIGKKLKDQQKAQLVEKHIYVLKNDNKLAKINKDELQQLASESIEVLKRERVAENMYFSNVAKCHNVEYLLRLNHGLKHRIWHAVKQMSFEEFKTYTGIYDASTLYDDDHKLRNYYRYAIERSNWPINLYMKMSKFLEYLNTKGVPMRELNLHNISPKLLHWIELVEYTNFDECMRYEYYKCHAAFFTMQHLRKAFWERYYDKCWTQDRWVEQIPCITDQNLCTRNSAVNVCDNDKNIILESYEFNIEAEEVQTQLNNAIVLNCDSEDSLLENASQMKLMEMEIQKKQNNNSPDVLPATTLSDDEPMAQTLNTQNNNLALMQFTETQMPKQLIETQTHHIQKYNLPSTYLAEPAAEYLQNDLLSTQLVETQNSPLQTQRFEDQALQIENNLQLNQFHTKDSIQNTGFIVEHEDVDAPHNSEVLEIPDENAVQKYNCNTNNLNTAHTEKQFLEESIVLNSQNFVDVENMQCTQTFNENDACSEDPLNQIVTDAVHDVVDEAHCEMNAVNVKQENINYLNNLYFALDSENSQSYTCDIIPQSIIVLDDNDDDGGHCDIENYLKKEENLFRMPKSNVNNLQFVDNRLLNETIDGSQQLLNATVSGEETQKYTCTEIQLDIGLTECVPSISRTATVNEEGTEKYTCTEIKQGTELTECVSSISISGSQMQPQADPQVISDKSSGIYKVQQEVKPPPAKKSKLTPSLVPQLTHEFRSLPLVAMCKLPSHLITPTDADNTSNEIVISAVKNRILNTTTQAATVVTNNYNNNVQPSFNLGQEYSNKAKETLSSTTAKDITVRQIKELSPSQALGVDNTLFNSTQLHRQLDEHIGATTSTTNINITGIVLPKCIKKNKNLIEEQQLKEHVAETTVIKNAKCVNIQEINSNKKLMKLRQSDEHIISTNKPTNATTTASSLRKYIIIRRATSREKKQGNNFGSTHSLPKICNTDSNEEKQQMQQQEQQQIKGKQSGENNAATTQPTDSATYFILPKNVIIRKVNSNEQLTDQRVIVYRALLEFHYIECLTPALIVQYNLGSNAVGQPYQQAMIFNEHKCNIYGPLLSTLFPYCSKTLLDDLHLILRDLKEFHYNCFKRSGNEDIRKLTLYYFMRTAPKFCYSLLHYEPGTRYWARCGPVDRSVHSYKGRRSRSLVETIKPSILKRIAEVKKNLKPDIRLN